MQALTGGSVTLGDVLSIVGAAREEYSRIENLAAHQEAYRIWRDRLPWRLVPAELRAKKLWPRFGAAFLYVFVAAWKSAYRSRRGLQGKTGASTWRGYSHLDLAGSVNHARLLASEAEVLLDPEGSDVRAATAEVVSRWKEISGLHHQLLGSRKRQGPEKSRAARDLFERTTQAMMRTPSEA